MALSLPVLDAPSGVTATYWRVAQINASRPDAAALVVLHGYTSAEVAARPDARAINAVQFPVQGEAFAAVTQRTLMDLWPEGVPEGATIYDVQATAAYQLIKSVEPQPGMPDFRGAEDC